MLDVMLDAVLDAVLEPLNANPPPAGSEPDATKVRTNPAWYASRRGTVRNARHAPALAPKAQHTHIPTRTDTG